MRRIGIIGGMSSESTGLYYARLNAEVRRRLGGLHSAEIILWSVDFADIAKMQHQGNWAEAGQSLAHLAQSLEGAGADVILLATNTMHKVADAISESITVPFLHIADVTGAALVKAGFKRPALMATAYTMEQNFITGRLARKFGLEVVLPEAQDRSTIHRIIFDELCRGEITASARQAFAEMTVRLKERGADSLILGCTEIGLLLNADNVALPVFDTVDCHVLAAVDFALSEPVLKAAE